jgi:hypothetical protein
MAALYIPAPGAVKRKERPKKWRPQGTAITKTDPVPGIKTDEMNDRSSLIRNPYNYNNVNGNGSTQHIPRTG